MRPAHLFLLSALFAVLLLFFALDLGRHLSLSAMQAGLGQIQALQQARPLLCAGAFFLLYVLTCGLSLPGAAILSLLAGALFGLLWGVVLVSFASVCGASIAFLLSRYLFQEVVQRRFARQMAPINAGFRREGGFYLFALRLVAVFPFFIVNLLMGLTPMPLRHFAWISQLGMLPATAVYVNAGQQLARIEVVSDILSPPLLLSLALLGLLPLLGKRTVELLRRRQAAALMTPAPGTTADKPDSADVSKT